MAAQAVCPHPCLKAPLRSSPETTSCPGREGQSPPQWQSTEGSTLKVPFCREAFVQLRLSHDGNAGDVLPLPRCSIPGTEKWVAWRLRQWASNHGAREARAAPPHGPGEPDVRVSASAPAPHHSWASFIIHGRSGTRLPAARRGFGPGWGLPESFPLIPASVCQHLESQNVPNAFRPQPWAF